MNTVVFILVGTVVNLVLAVFFIGVLLFVVKGLSGMLPSQTANLVPFAFIGGILIAMIVYQKLTKYVIDKFNMADKLDPLFTLKQGKKSKKFD